MMISICLRFIPILQAEAQKLIRAQLARGINFFQQNLIKRAQNMLALLVPLILSAQRRAENLSMAMHARGYTRQRKRTYLYPLRLGASDYVAISVVTGLILVASVLEAYA